MQVVLGSNGQIGTELARELCEHHTSTIRLVSRKPVKVNASDSLYPADLLDSQQTSDAVQGAEVVYFTAGLPPDTKLWETNFPVMLRNALDACLKHQVKFVYFDNTYMYPQDDQVATESTRFAPHGRKGKVRAMMADMVMDEMTKARIPVTICRAPEFYGPGKTQSVTNAMIIEPILKGKRPRVPVRDDVLRTLIWTPDASRAMALIGNTEDAFQRVWHLPCDDNRLTYREFVQLAADVFEVAPDYQVLSKLTLSLMAWVSKDVRELKELLPRYGCDNLFDSSAFKQRFPDFRVTRYREGLEQIREASSR